MSQIMNLLRRSGLVCRLIGHQWTAAELVALLTARGRTRPRRCLYCLRCAEHTLPL